MTDLYIGVSSLSFMGGFESASSNADATVERRKRPDHVHCTRRQMLQRIATGFGAISLSSLLTPDTANATECCCRSGQERVLHQIVRMGNLTMLIDPQAAPQLQKLGVRVTPSSDQENGKLQVEFPMSNGTTPIEVPPNVSTIVADATIDGLVHMHALNDGFRSNGDNAAIVTRQGLARRTCGGGMGQPFYNAIPGAADSATEQYTWLMHRLRGAPTAVAQNMECYRSGEDTLTVAAGSSAGRRSMRTAGIALDRYKPEVEIQLPPALLEDAQWTKLDLGNVRTDQNAKLFEQAGINSQRSAFSLGFARHFRTNPSHTIEPEVQLIIPEHLGLNRATRKTSHAVLVHGKQKDALILEGNTDLRQLLA